MGFRTATGPAESPWRIREGAMRRLGKMRRKIADAAVEGVLPSEEDREHYFRASMAFDTAHRNWQESRNAAQPTSGSRVVGSTSS